MAWAAAPGSILVQLTNCHIHTFTANHVPDRFAGAWSPLLRTIAGSGKLLRFLQRLGGTDRDRLERYARILEISRSGSQEDIFKIVRGFYPQGTRFVVLPMDMTFMGAGGLRASIDDQHAELARLRDAYPDLVVPFAAVDPRHPDVVERTIRLLEEDGFCGIKLYPPLGYHPNDPALAPVYAYAAERGYPVMTHCSRGGVHYRGELTERMLTDPESGRRLAGVEREQLVTGFANPENYRPILEKHPKLRLCLAHFGGAADWESYLKEPWLGCSANTPKSWLATIADLIRAGTYENLYTDISFTVFADDEYVYLLKVLLSDSRIRNRVLFGSDFYVVEDARLEERHRSVRVRSVLGEDLFHTIAEVNPRRYLAN